MAFDWCGRRLASVSADCSARIYDACTDFRELAVMIGHTDEISKVSSSNKNLIKKITEKMGYSQCNI